LGRYEKCVVGCGVWVSRGEGFECMLGKTSGGCTTSPEGWLLCPYPSKEPVSALYPGQGREGLILSINLL